MTSQVSCPSGLKIEIEYYGEHHMGVEHVELVPSKPIDGIERFYSTNGTVFFDPIVERMFIYDATLIVEVDPVTLECRHMDRPPRWYIGKFERKEEEFLIDLYSGYGKNQKLVLSHDEIEWKSGLGPASKGKFPSTYEPSCTK